MRVLRHAGLVTDRRYAQWMRSPRPPEIAREIAAVLNAALALTAEQESEVA
ncbi:ArsR family transcriptional regulator [Sedimentitalea nanhaiensis]|uniref:ArsR family transcriptional regulator n=1 Tax=Sedimentitalea nanhaiensis TaxID=999627 RepID=A0A1I7DXJ3_9RHOB|nr:ArsR family transcriptional regulator [Sedimentitalea nanhaiensis]